MTMYDRFQNIIKVNNADVLSVHVLIENTTLELIGVHSSPPNPKLSWPEGFMVGVEEGKVTLRPDRSLLGDIPGGRASDSPLGLQTIKCLLHTITSD